MQFEIKNRWSGAVQLKIEGDSFKAALQIAVGNKADLREADLRGANLRGADLREADLRGANLRGADLQEADLQEAGLREADLWGANLRGANLQKANLRGADLRGADLREADLRGANLDFSCLPLWCGSFGLKADDRIVAQIFAHWARLDVSQCSPMVRYVHRILCGMFGKYMANLFCEYRDDVKKI